MGMVAVVSYKYQRLREEKSQQRFYLKVNNKSIQPNIKGLIQHQNIFVELSEENCTYLSTRDQNRKDCRETNCIKDRIFTARKSSFSGEEIYLRNSWICRLVMCQNKLIEQKNWDFLFSWTATHVAATFCFSLWFLLSLSILPDSWDWKLNSCTVVEGTLLEEGLQQLGRSSV